MPHSHPDGGATAEKLGRFLVGVFPPSKASVSRAADAPHPFLLLSVQNDLAGFAVADADPRQSFDRSYSYFKELYAERHLEWDALNISFILCIRHREPQLETFCARVETDSFFCRKFTVALDGPWDVELARLPFFPLERGDEVFHRPPSALNLLGRRGVGVDLAAAVVGRVGEATILRDCFRGRFGRPELRDDADGSREGTAGVTAPQLIRLQSLEIENFRAYRRPQIFDLDADLVILYGANGVGKTSFFDAIDFAATGGIGRLSLSPEQRLAKATTHLLAKPDTSSVTLTVRARSGDHLVRRTVPHRLRPTVDGKSRQRKAALLTLTGKHHHVGADHIEHLVRLFRATHLFSQEFQTLTEDFRKHCRLSEAVVSRMLTFEDYVNARRKISGVLDLLKHRAEDRRRREEDLRQELDANRREQKLLQNSLRSTQDPKALARLRESICKKLAAVGIKAEHNDDSVVEIRGWRAVLEARLSDARSLAARLDEVQSEGARIAPLRRGLAARQAKYATGQKKLKETDDHIHQLREATTRIERELAALRARESASLERAEALAWLRRTRPAYETLHTRRVGLAAEVGSLTKRLADHNAILEELATASRSAGERLAEAEERERDNRLELDSLRRFAARCPALRRATARRQSVETQLEHDKAELNRVRKRRQASETMLAETKLAERRAKGDLAAAQKTQSGLHSLLVALEEHVRDAHCPACGTQHQSREELLRRMRERRDGTAASDKAASRLQEIRRKTADLNSTMDELADTERALEGSLDRSAGELDAVISEIEDIEALATRAELDPRSPDLEALSRRRVTAAERESRDVAETVRERQSLVESTRARLEDGRSQARAWTEDLAAKQEAWADAATKLDELRGEATKLRVGLDTDPKADQEEEASQRRDAEAIAVDAALKGAELRTNQTSMAEHERHAQTLRKELETEQQALLKAQRDIEKHERDMSGLGLARDADEAQIAERMARENHTIEVFETLKRSMISAEMGLDAARTSAAAERLSDAIRKVERALREIGAEASGDRPWKAYFGELHGILQQTQNTAVAEYTDRYGPLTSTIQRRLRPVSGFEDVLLIPDANGIQVRATRGSEHLPPTDFFSQSQQQILMLSLFLTACVTQTWSAFAPILLDDPVTHFDDLNAYSFLDLLGGFIDTEPAGRQFIVSTCDERLFQLAQQRFQHLRERMRTYRFVAVGPEGPVIESG